MFPQMEWRLFWIFRFGMLFGTECCHWLQWSSLFSQFGHRKWFFHQHRKEFLDGSCHGMSSGIFDRHLWAHWWAQRLLKDYCTRGWQIELILPMKFLPWKFWTHQVIWRLILNLRWDFQDILQFDHQSPQTLLTKAAQLQSCRKHFWFCFVAKLKISLKSIPEPKSLWWHASLEMTVLMI